MPVELEGPKLIFDNNTLKVVVAQVRFGPIYSLDEARGIAPFQEAIRQAYPIAEPRAQEVSVAVGPTGIGSPMTQQGAWRFFTEDSKWIVAVTPDSLSLETTDYVRFESFRARLQEVLSKAADIIRIGQRNRIGLRYINEITHPEAKTVSDWSEFLDVALLGIAAGDKLKDQVQQALQQIEVRNEFASLTIRHGYLRQDPGSLYVLDLDAYDQTQCEFDVQDVISKFSDFNKLIYDFFVSSITNKLKDYLGAQEETSE